MASVVTSAVLSSLPQIPSLNAAADPPASISIAGQILNQPQTRPQNYPAPIHWSTFVTGTGVLVSIVLIISGVATSVFSLVFLGSFFLLSSAVGTYYTYSNRFLKTLDEFNEAFESLNDDLAKKNKEIQALITRVEALSHQFTDQQKKYTDALKTNNDVAAHLQAELIDAQTKLQNATDQFSQAQARASADFETKSALYLNSETKLRQQVQADLDQIASLRDTAQVTKGEIDQLQQQQQELSQQLVQYKQLNGNYAAQNNRLAEQIVELKRVLSTPGIDPVAAQQHAADIQKLVATHLDNTNQLAQATTQFNGMLSQIDAINRRLALLSTKIPPKQ